jgi:cell wall-associated NlpC family hydrolase
MTEQQARIIQEARSWVDTPWGHQGRSRRRLDCGGLPVCIARALGWRAPDLTGYSRYPDGVTLRAHMREHLVPIRRVDLQPGDVLLFLDLLPGRWPCHVAIVADSPERLTIIHSSALERRVVENGLDPSWEAKIAGCFRYQEIAEEIGPWRN